MEIKISDVDVEKRLKVRDIIISESKKSDIKIDRDQIEGEAQNVLNFDSVIRVPCIMDFDAAWNPINGKKNPFYVHHAVAPNIGESAYAEDFFIFSEGEKLDATKYAETFTGIVKKVIRKQVESGVKIIVWIPFGMGAFMRNISLNDPEFTKAKTDRLRRCLAYGFAIAILEEIGNEDIKFYMCSPYITEENKANVHAFENAFKGIKDIYGNNVDVLRDIDASSFAQKCANENGPYTVSLCNAANKHKIGNVWKSKYAIQAVDENLHRRSVMLAILAEELNRKFKLK